MLRETKATYEKSKNKFNLPTRTQNTADIGASTHRVPELVVIVDDRLAVSLGQRALEARRTRSRRRPAHGVAGGVAAALASRSHTPS